MGAESSTLKELSLGQPYFSNSDSAIKVTVCPGTSQVDNKKYTVFQYPKDGHKLDASVEKHLEVLRTTRHPHILKHVATFNESRQTTLVTEHAIPLDVAIERQEKDEIFVGLYNILEAIIFLHDRSNICHNGISVSTVFVADNGDWKLSAFETSTKVQRLAKQSYHADISGFGEFALSVLEYLKDDGPKTTAFMKRLQEEFVDDKQEILGSLKLLREDTFFKFPFIEVVNGLKNLPLKSNTEKESFFSTLEQSIHASPPQVVCRKCVPMLFSPIVLLDPHAQEKFLKYLFSSGSESCLRQDGLPLFDEEYFIKYCLPCIYELFHSQDAMIRLVLMKYLPLYVDCIKKETLQHDILPQLLNGLQDSNDTIIAATFQALSAIVPILGGEVVIGSPGRKIFFDQTPDFSRVENTREPVRSPKNVGDIMATKTLKSTQSKTLHSDSVSDEKRLKRMEREKQREEQRKKREERRRQREEQKFARIQKQSSDDGSIELNENISSSNYNNQDEVQTDQMPSRPEPRNNHEDVSGELSEPDWEGFEAFSNDGSDDPEKVEIQARVSHLPSYNQRSDSNSVFHNNMPEPSWTLHEKDSSRNSRNSEGDDAWDNWDEEEETAGHVTDIPTGTSNSRASVVESNSLVSVTDEVIKQPSKSKGLVLSGNKKKITPNSSKNNETKTVTNSNKRSTNNDSLGEEYHVKINTNAAAFSEPDYFADMLPSVEDFSKNTIKIERKSEVSSKFQALPETNSEEVSGWNDEDGDGWGSDGF